MLNRFRMEASALGVYLALLAFPISAPCQQPASAQRHPTLPIGAPAPDFSLPGIDGKQKQSKSMVYSYSNYRS